MTAILANAITSICQNTAAEWTASNVPIDRGVLCYEIDTGKMKVGAKTGDVLYSALPYAIDEVFTTAFKNMLVNANAIGGVVTVNGSGKIDPSLIDTQFQNKPVFLATYASFATLTTPESRTNAMFYVLDATGDPSGTVTTGWALYIRNIDDTAWLKIDEGESLDLNVTSFMSTNTLYLIQPPLDAAGYYTTP